MKNPNHVAQGQRLKLLRKERRLNVEFVADTIGVAPSTVRAHENGQNGFNAELAARYARLYEVSPEWLLFGTGDFNFGPMSPPPAPNTPVQMTADRRGNARLQIDKTVPMSVALKVLALLEGE